MIGSVVSGYSKIHDLIRGVTPSLGAYTYYCAKDTEEKKRLIILKAQIHESSNTKTALNPGTVVEIAPCGIHVATLDGFLCINDCNLKASGRWMHRNTYGGIK